MKKILSVLLASFMILTLTSCGFFNSDQIIDKIKDFDILENFDILKNNKDLFEETKTEQINETETETTKATVNGSDFSSFYDNLVSENGLIEKHQSGVVDNYEGCNWLNPNGIITNKFADFDNDGDDEMLVVYTKQDVDQFTEREIYNIYFDMYENNAGEIELTDTMQFVSYHETKDEFAGIYLAEMQSEEVFAKVSIARSNGIYLLCENRFRGAALGNGASQDLWLVEYKNNEFCYKASLTQTGGGSSDFAYTNFTFENGNLDNATVCYDEWYQNTGEGTEPLYNDFGDAVENFLDPFSLNADDDVKNARWPYDDEIDFFDSFVDTETVDIFTITNEVESRDYSDENSFGIISFEFEIE